MTQLNDNSTRTPVLGCVADDVTGATDLAINLVQGGMRVLQMLGIPNADTLSQADDFDAIVVALKTRSIPKDQAIEQSLEALRALQQIGASRFYFKYCSTFDSTEAGNIGPVAEAMMSHLGVDYTVFCPAFPRAGRTVYSGHLFVGNALLNECGMQDHPLNPMTDANLVRFLSKQSSQAVGLFGHENYADPPETYGEKLESLAQQSPLIITDICNDEQLDRLAKGVGELPLVTGGSGLARFLPNALRKLGVLKSNEYTPALPRVDGRSLIVAGSCSTATNSQVSWMQDKCPHWPVDVAGVMANANTEFEKVQDWARVSAADQPLLIYSSAPPEQVTELQDQFGRDAVAEKLETFLARVTCALVNEMDFRRLVLAGGETSGAIVAALGVEALSIGPEICVGVPWTESYGARRLALALKSGNFGERDFFQTALEMLP